MTIEIEPDQTSATKAFRQLDYCKTQALAAPFHPTYLPLVVGRPPQCGSSPPGLLGEQVRVMTPCVSRTPPHSPHPPHSGEEKSEWSSYQPARHWKGSETPGTAEGLLDTLEAAVSPPPDLHRRAGTGCAVHQRRNGPLIHQRLAVELVKVFASARSLVCPCRCIRPVAVPPATPLPSHGGPAPGITHLRVKGDRCQCQ